MANLKFRFKPVLILVLLLYVLLLGVLSLMPNPPEPPQMMSWDKLEHTLAYSVLAPLCFIVLPDRFSPWRRIFLAAGLSWGTGAVFEILQGVLHLGRIFEWTDLLANLIGTVLGLGLILLVLPRLPQGALNED